MPNEERAGPTEEGEEEGANGDVQSISGDEDPVCSICLGNFVRPHQGFHARSDTQHARALTAAWIASW